MFRAGVGPVRRGLEGGVGMSTMRCAASGNRRSACRYGCGQVTTTAPALATFSRTTAAYPGEWKSASRCRRSCRTTTDLPDPVGAQWNGYRVTSALDDGGPERWRSRLTVRRTATELRIRVGVQRRSSCPAGLSDRSGWVTSVQSIRSVGR
ncbi:hypothetical protein Jiend_08650 [Micromonospora endophytica]|nr:hypothetical protein Jiend_08650 [Micromonospora endophytica]